MASGEPNRERATAEESGQQEWVAGESRQRPWLQYAVVGTLILILTLFFWPFGGDRGSSVEPGPEQPVEAREPTPEPTPDATAEAAMPIYLCTPGDVTQPFVDFLAAFNSGDFDRVREMLPEQSSFRAPTSIVGSRADQDQLYGFYHQSRSGLGDRDDIVRFLEERHAAGERWRLFEFRLARQYMDPLRGNPELDTVTARLQRRADDLPTHVVEGTVMINCVEDLVIHWHFFSDDPDLAEPIGVEHFLSTIGPYNPGQMRYMRVIVTTDLRPDGGAPGEWLIERDEATSTEGRFVERVIVRDLDGEQLIIYVYDGENWFSDIRGWQAKGVFASAPILPFEIAVARQDPTRSAHVIRDQLDEIPDEGVFIVSRDVDDVPAELQIQARFIETPISEQFFDVVLDDRALTHSRFRMIDDEGALYLTPEIRWVEIRRAEGYDGSLFLLPGGASDPGYQYRQPDPLPEGLYILSSAREQGGQRERYRMLWGVGAEVELLVRPSRGGLDPRVPIDDWDIAWAVTVTETDVGPVVWASRNDEDFPLAAVWDTGQYRFDMRLVDFHASHAPDIVWDEEAMFALIEALSQTP